MHWLRTCHLVLFYLQYMKKKNHNTHTYSIRIWFNKGFVAFLNLANTIATSSSLFLSFISARSIFTVMLYTYLVCWGNFCCNLQRNGDTERSYVEKGKKCVRYSLIPRRKRRQSKSRANIDVARYILKCLRHKKMYCSFEWRMALKDKRTEAAENITCECF
jgi:hypothetical protein